jgi:Glycosyl hydrolases family 2, sugar binding domain
VVEQHELDLTTLRPWSEIPELQDVSGVGTYTTTFGLPANWSSSHGAYLDLGTVFDTFRVEVNGRELPGVDQANPVVDVSSYLKAGGNTLKVTVATTLRSRMRTVVGSGQANSPRQAYGLVGPVVITPYVERTIKR